jgi:hypothetical protein
MAKIKVSQATIDQIKKMGMDKALKSAANASPEMKEGLRRMYGEKRLAAAGGSTKAAAKSSAPGAISGKMKSSSTSNKPKSSAPSAISGKKVATTSAKKATPAKKSNTTSNPVTALHNKLSPYGDKTQKFKSPVGEGLSTKKSVKGKPSVGEQISGVFSGKTSLGPKRTSESVAATMSKRMGISVAEYNRRLAAATKKK